MYLTHPEGPPIGREYRKIEFSGSLCGVDGNWRVVSGNKYKGMACFQKHFRVGLLSPRIVWPGDTNSLSSHIYK